ncbi:PKD domain-containing protein [Candidatus Peregrinibacteria bacterium]|nr:PKD domain-containing protein [Candidatus Peregrinibacteria bacterium]
MKKITLGLALAFGLLWQTVSYAQTVTLGKPTTLRAQSSSAQSYEWTFPGGVVINGEVVQYTFTEPGVQEVKLKVTDQEGNTNEIIKRILVANNGRPTAIIETTVNGKVVTGNVIEATLEDSIALKSNSFAVEKTAKDFTEIWSVNGRNYSVDSLPSVFDKIGTYSVKLAVQDPLNSNQQDQASVQVKINNMPPVIKSVQFQPLGNSQEQFQVGVEAEDPDGTLSTYKFEALEAGKTMMTQVVESNITVFDLSRFPGAHTYNFRVTVSDDRFLSTTFTDSKTITVDPLNTNTPPEVTLQVLPGNQAYTGEAFDLKASATDADNDSLKYEWISSDGRRSSSSAFQLVFSKAGKYSITLNVSDGLATTTEKLDLIVLEPEVIELQNTAPEVEIYGVLPADTAPMNSMFRFYLKANDADEDRLTYEWDFGNGAKSFTQNAAILYNLPGDYTVTVKVSDGIETVTDEVRLTVELGPNEIYYESVEDRLVDLQSERQRILDAIAANGGEITPAQQAQLQALNNDIADLVGQARTAGDFTAIKKLEEISRSLDLALLSIEAEVVDGMTLTELGEKLKEEQSEEIKAIEDEADILAEIDAEIKRVEAERVKTVIDNAVVENDFLKTNIAELNDGLRKQKADLIIELEGYRAAGDTLNATRAADRLAVVNGQIDQAIIDTGLVLESVTNSRTALETEKARLETELEGYRDAGDVANATRAQGRLDVVNGQIDQAIIDTGLVLESVTNSRTALETEKTDLEVELERLKDAGDLANATRAQDRLDIVNGQIDQAIIDTGLVLESVTNSRTALETEKARLETELEGYRDAGDTANATRAQDRLDVVNGQINQAIIDTGVVLDAVKASREMLETEKFDLEAELDTLRAAGDTANATRAQDRLDVVNGQINQAIIDTGVVLDAVKASREMLETEKFDLEAELDTLRAAGDTANATRVQERLDVVNRQIDQAIIDTGLVLGLVTASRTELETDKTNLEADLRGFRAAGDTANATRAQEQLDLVNARIDQAIIDTGVVLDAVTASRTALETEKTQLEADLTALRAAGNTANATRAQERLDVVNGQIEQAIIDTDLVLDSVTTSRQLIETQKTDLEAEVEALRASGDTANANRAQEQLDLVNARIDQAVLDTGLILESVAASRELLETEKTDLRAEIETLKSAGNTANAKRAQDRLEAVNSQIEAAQESTLQIKESLDLSRESLAQEKINLKADLELARSTGDQANQARLEARAIEVNDSIVQANEATVALLSEIEQMRLDLEAEQADQLKVLADAKAAGSSENTARAQARLTEVNAQLAAAKAAQAETQTSIDAQRTALEQSKEDLYKEYAEAKAAGNEANVARVKAQIIETEEMLASLSSKSSEEYYAEQRAKYEARKTSVELVISELEKAEKSGKTVDQFTAALQTQADTANPNSDEFKSAAGALEQQALINRAEFLGEQIDSLEALAKNPTELPPLGVDRQSNETLEQRLDRIENQAERASIEAAQRQNAASQIAAAKQAQQIELLRRLESELAAENDQGRRTVLSARIGVLEKEIAQLEQIKNPNEVLSSADIAKRVAELTAAAATTNDIVITEQQAFIATRLAELQVEIDLAADPRVKADLEAQKKRLEANLNQTGILTDYEAQLKASQKALNERLATDLNTTAELLVQTQLNSVETKLGNLEKLSAAQAELNSLQVSEVNDPDGQAVAFLKTEKEALELELRELKANKSRTSDAIEIKSLEQREAEVVKLLSEFPDTNVEQASIDSLRVIEAIEYLKHYRFVESNALSLGVEDEKPAKLALIDSQIKLLTSLNSFGYTPQTRLSNMLIDLERREGELLTLFRESDGAKATEIKERLVVIAEAMDQINGLEQYQINKNDTVFKATQKLEVAIESASAAYLEAKTETARIVALQTLNDMRVSERWLNRFYNADKRDTTIAELENDLRAKITSGGGGNAVNDLVAMQSIKANLDLAIAARVESDFENFKLNLQKQAAQVSDPVEKAAIESRIKSLNYEDLVDDITLAKAQMFEEMLADMRIKVDTNLFLYADVPLTQYAEPLLFEWDLGDGEKRFGQNISHEYYEPGFYRVVMTMFDGVTSQQDLFTIKVSE